MSACSDLLAGYNEWQRWTELETQAIEADDWNRVSRCQTAKQCLQATIAACTASVRDEATRLGRDAAHVRREVVAKIEELIRLEERNRETLARKRQAAETERNRLEHSQRTLRRVHRSYVPPRSAVWTSFS